MNKASLRKPARWLPPWLALLALATLAALATPAAAQTPLPQVLILDSYHQGEDWSDNELAGLLPVLREAYPDLVPSIERLDAKRRPGPENLSLMTRHLEEKYGDRRPDLVIALDNSALDLALGQRARLFPGAPVVFAGVNGYTPAMTAGREKVTGVQENQDFAGTLSLILTLRPGTKRVLAVCDHTDSGKAVRGEVEALAPAFQGRLQIVFSPNIPFAELENQLRNLTPDWAVMILTYVTDSAGRTLTRAESTRLISQASPVPVFAMHETRLGHGILGGMLLEGKAHGAQAGRLALRVLAGADFAELPVAASDSNPVFDHRQLLRFAIPPESLPPGSRVIARPESAWDRHSNVLLPLLTALGVAVIMVALLSSALLRGRRAEAALKRSQEHFRDLVEGTGDLVAQVDAQGRFTYVNHVAAQAFGLPPEQCLGLSLFDFIHEEDRRGAREEFFSWARAKPASVSMENRLVSRGGRVRHMLWSSSPHYNPKGELALVNSIARDITERIQAEADLRASEEKHRRLFEHSNDAIFVHDDQGNFLDVNERACELLGYSRQEFLSLRTTQCHPPQALPGARQAFMELQTNGRASFETVFLRADGSQVEVEISVSPTGEGETTYQALARDISQRKRTEQELAEREEKFRSLFSSMTELAVLHELVLDQDGQPADYRILDCNPAFTRITGIPRERARGVLASRIYGVEPAPFLDIYAHTARTGEPARFETYFQPMDKHFAISVFAVGKDRFATIASDVTEIKKGETEKTRLEAQLRQAQKMEAIGTLAGGIAHDFNNILAAIMGFAELALEDALADRSDPADLRQIIQSAQRAKALVRQILAFSRKSEPDLRPLSPNQIIRRAHAIIERTIPKMIRTEVVLAEELPLVQGDPNQLEQVILNLASNASDAMPEGGRLVMETQSVILDEEFCRLRLEVRPGPYALILISDTGHGMDQEVREQIFDPFYTTKEIGKGTGLGLSSAYGIVKNHGGHIHCYSEPGTGTTFKVYLPAFVPRGDLASPEDARLEEAGLAGRERILLADDEVPLRDFVARILSSKGYQVLTSASGEEALDIYRAQGRNLDLVILDLGMPGMGGHKAMREILALDPQAKVLIASGYTVNGRVKASLEAGAAGYVPKPFRRADLLLAVRKALDEKPSA